MIGIDGSSHTSGSMEDTLMCKHMGTNHSVVNLRVFFFIFFPFSFRVRKTDIYLVETILETEFCSFFGLADV